MEENKHDIESEEISGDYVVKKNKKLNIFALVVCLIISATIWLYVMNTENSQYEKTYSEIPVLIEGDTVLEKLHDMSIISGYNSYVNVTVKGNKSDIDELALSDFIAYASVEDITTAGRHSVTVSVEPIKDVTFTNISGITIYVDKNVTTEFEIETDIGYSIANNYSFEYKSLIETVSVTGPAEVVDTIKHALVKYDLGTVTTSLKFKSSIELYDENYKLIENPYIVKNVNEAEVKVDITTNSEIPLSTVYTASDTDMYIYTVTILPETLIIYGDPIYVNKVANLEIELGDITAKTSGQVETSSVVIPTNTILRDGQTEIIRYTVEKTLKTPVVQP